jgi:2-oxoglutarate ferredoxin oxidoreductase subunit gamma
MRYEVRLSGSGGQGLILIGIILAEAAGIYDGKNVVQTQSYGPEARGGASKSEVIISDGTIYYPKATQLDFLLSMTQKSCDEYYLDLKKDGILLVDSTLVHQVPTNQAFEIPFTHLAKEELGKPFVANIIAIGAIAHISGIIKEASLTKAVLKRVPSWSAELNKKALQIGMEEGKKAAARISN